MNHAMFTNEKYVHYNFALALSFHTNIDQKRHTQMGSQSATGNNNNSNNGQNAATRSQVQTIKTHVDRAPGAKRSRLLQASRATRRTQGPQSRSSPE